MPSADPACRPWDHTQVLAALRCELSNQHSLGTAFSHSSGLRSTRLQMEARTSGVMESCQNREPSSGTVAPTSSEAVGKQGPRKGSTSSAKLRFSKGRTAATPSKSQHKRAANPLRASSPLMDARNTPDFKQTASVLGKTTASLTPYKLFTICRRHLERQHHTTLGFRHLSWLHSLITQLEKGHSVLFTHTL